ncbi:hypothetical protein [Desulfurobacterium indicum]|uniref:Uncharacterized protein n=1 Tax=Desulfurobacterium indicum TaxID=1914305 RepID=A0A1R1MKT0_9BACT|nr:hypothetical protein [Desulfurobacterium indicum]OMH40412.1 hypothetical protein BLW93_05320 [Desulfurobacterium indicum]
MALKNKLLIVIGIFTGIIVAFIAAVFLFLYKPSFFLSLIFGKEEIPIVKKEENTTLTQKELYRLEEVVTKNLVEIKEGIALHPAVVLKVTQNGNQTDAYILTISELEWPFIKTLIRGGITLDKVKQVYKCGNIYLIDYDITGMWVPSVKAGPFIDKGVIVPGIDNGEPIIMPFYGNCTQTSGLVFNNFGDFAGVCVTGKFVPSDFIETLNPSTCIPLLHPENETENATGSVTNSTTATVPTLNRTNITTGNNITQNGTTNQDSTEEK